MNTSIFIPTCGFCKKRLSDASSVFCIECMGDLPYTYFYIGQSNIIKDRLKALLRLNYAGSYLFYHNNEMVKQLLWEIKYNQNTQLALELGRLAVSKHIDLFKQNFDIIIPIPLHRHKLQQRGYNQSEFLAEGMNQSTNLPIAIDVLKRTKYTQSQTLHNRSGRFDNVNEAFRIDRPEKIQNKRVLLIDDVITTGATLEAAGEALLRQPIKSLNIFTLACAITI